MNPIQKQEVTPSDLLQIAVSKDLDVEKLSKLLELQVRYEDRQAKKAYDQAMAQFRSACPEIFKTKKGHNSNYAPLDEIVDVIKQNECAFGFNHSWIPSIIDNKVAVTCKVTHIEGHTEEATLTAPPDTSGSKNALQGIGSTIAYLERYTLCAIFGLAPQNMDNDGKNNTDPLPKSKEFLIEGILNKAYDNFVNATKKIIPKGKAPNYGLFKAELKRLYKDLEEDERAKFQWNEIGVNKLVAKLEISRILEDAGEEISEIPTNDSHQEEIAAPAPRKRTRKASVEEGKEPLPEEDPVIDADPEDYLYICNECGDGFDIPSTNSKGNHFCPSCKKPNYSAVADIRDAEKTAAEKY